MGGRRSCLVTLLLLCSSFFLLSVTADDYVDCTYPFPDEFLDILGLMEIPLEDFINQILPILFGINPGLKQHNHSNQLEIEFTTTSKIILSTVIRI